MKKIIRKISHMIKRLLLVAKSLRKVYRHGGYSTVNIANINHGEILRQKKILITGGSSGIGLSIAEKCLKEGATVLITGRDENKLQQAKDFLDNQSLKILVWDISLIEQIDKNIVEAEKLLGGEIDILVNNAGIMNGNAFPNVTEKIWDSIYATNSKGLFFLTQSVCGKWIKNNKVQLKKVLKIYLLKEVLLVLHILIE